MTYTNIHKHSTDASLWIFGHISKLVSLPVQNLVRPWCTRQVTWQVIQNFRYDVSCQLITTLQILKLADMFYSSYTDIWLNFPIKCCGTLYYGACTSIFAHRILRLNHEFLMPKLYMHTLLKSSPLLKNYAVIKVCLGLPSAQFKKAFRRAHIIPPSWGWSGFCVPSLFPFIWIFPQQSLSRISFCFELRNHL